MAYWNHFSERKYETMCFGELSIGEKFRMDRFKGKRRRKDIIMVKTGDRSFIEFRSKKETIVSSSSFDVSHYSKLRVGVV